MYVMTSNGVRMHIGPYSWLFSHVKCSITRFLHPSHHPYTSPQARFTKYLTTIYDYLTIMPKLRSTYDRRLITRSHGSARVL